MSTAIRRSYIRIAALLAAVLLIPPGIHSAAQAAPKVKAKNQATAVAYSPDGDRVAVGAGDGKVAVFSVATGKQVLNLAGHVGAPVTGVAYSPAGDLLATAGRDSTVQLWEASSGKRIAVLHGQEQAVLSIAFSPDGSRLVTGGEDSRVLVWNVAEQSLAKVITGNTDFVTAVAVSSDGKTIASATKDARITLRDSKTFKKEATLLGHAGEVTSLAFSPDGRWLASGSTDKQVKVWDMPTRSERRALKGHDDAVTGLAFDADGTSLASGGKDGKVEIWDPVRGVRKAEATEATDAVSGVAFSPVGDKVVEGRANGLANLRRAASADVEKTFVLPDAETVATPSTDTPSTSKGSNGSKESRPSTSKSSSAETDSSTLSKQIAPLSIEPMATGAGSSSPILVVTSAADPYSTYYSEILQAEGLNLFATADVSSLDASTLAGHDVVLLGARTLTSAQVTALTDWVTAGGNLVAMRPDPQLAGLLGLSGGSSTLSEGYLKVDTTTAPGNGIVAETIQYHGAADRYALDGARAVATLYSDAATATSSPAVSLRSVGAQGGQAAAFAFDLAKSIVYTRQGNPAWAGDERDGFSPVRSDDMYYGAKAGDVKKDWIDLNKVAIPQADEQQRLLVNLILEMNADRNPLPRFWYLPRGLKAAVIMTGDDHGNNGTEGRFNQFLAESPENCSVDDWECIRGTSYVYPSTPLSNAKAAEFAAQGFEIGLHVSTSCSDYTPASLASNYSDQLAAFAQKWPSLSSPKTNRTHCIAWSDWSTQANVELSNGIRLDTNYYYWPPSWVQDRAGFFTGSGIPMRFTDETGATIDVYQAATQMTDESGQSYPTVIDALLDRALGAEGYYGAFTINAHTDAAEITESDAVIASAKARGVPIVSSKQMLDWLDARNSSSFQGVTWSNGTLTFSVAPGAGARNLDMLVPTKSAAGTLSEVTRDGSSVSFETRAVKGADYALVRATTGTYVATYTQDTSAPTVTTVSPTDGATDVIQSTSVTATFSEAMDPATVTSDTFQLLDATNLPVQSSVAYDPFAKTARLTPLTSLDPAASYRAVLYAGTGTGSGTSGGTTPAGVTDTSGNPLASDKAWSFSTANGPTCPCSLWSPSATPGVQTVVDPNAVELGVKFRSDIDGYITGIRFYKGPQNTGTHTGSLWTTAGQRLAQAEFTVETGSGWQEVSFDSPVAVTANTTYVASYHTPTGYYSADNGFFATAGVDNAPLHAPSTTAVSGNGVYAYSGSPTFPNNTWQGTNYWVDVVFTDTTGPDTTPPTVTTTSPADGATDIGKTSVVSATFSEPMDAATVSGSTFELRDSDDALVAATVAYDEATRTATLTPGSALADEATYRATVKGGATDPRVKDGAGNALAETVSWSFTTAAEAQCDPCSIWPSTAEPTKKVDNDRNAVELGVKFRTDVDGFITGVKFWKGDQNTGTHTGSLWSASGEQLATATFTNETASGWQAVTFDAPVPVTANTTYVASYHTPTGYYAGDNDFFATTGVDRPPLHALATGVSGSNGVYAYSSTPTFPTDSWRSSNYWVDVTFTTQVAPDTTAPKVTGTSPSATATGVATTSAVRATFDEALDPATVTGQTASLSGPDGAVDVQVSYEAASTSVVIQPNAALTPSTQYTARLVGGSADPRIKDVAGNALATDMVWGFTTAEPGPCDGAANPTVAENCLPGSPESEWDVTGIGDSTIQGFATDISVNQGGTVDFKIDTTASSYRVDIYRLGYYGGDGARKVATIPASSTTPRNQPACLTDPATGLVDCGNWSKSASWQVPASATSGVYLARPVRTDSGGASHIPFVVRSDSSTSDIVFQTSDTTWQAYNTYGGNSLYEGSPDGRAYKVSYNRPFSTRVVDGGQDWIFHTEYPMIRWLERNGYDVSYISGVDSDRRGDQIRQHKTFLSVGHDEYWSATQRAKVEAARDAGVNLAFFSGNEIFWKTRWEDSIDGSGTSHRTLVCYKETKAGEKIDPNAAWTGTWRDPRFSPPSDGGRPENALSGTIFMVNEGATTSIKVPAADGKMRFWRNTDVANLPAGATATMPDGTLGYEWDTDEDNGFRPAGLVRLSTTTVTGAPVLQDYGDTYSSGTATHHLTLYRQPGGGLVFGAGTVQWSWGLDAEHDNAGTPVSADMRQATVNLFADMDAQPATLQSGLTRATKSTDAAAPTVQITAPADGTRIDPEAQVTITGTAVDSDGQVGAVEVSTDGGSTWHPAAGRASWTYEWNAPDSGNVTIKVRAADDSGNLQSSPASITVDVSAPPPPAEPTGLTATASATGITLDWADGGSDVTGYNVYRSTSATGTFTKVNGAAVSASAWDDTTAPAGTSYYQVTAVNAGGAESAPSGQANASMSKPILLVNPSFEIDTNADGRPDSWTSSARFTRSTDAVRSGTYSGRHLTTANASYTIGQTKTGLTAGTSYDVAGWVNIPDTSDSFTFSIQVQWRNSSNTVIGTETVATYSAGTSGWVKATGTYTAPTGTTRAVVNMVSSSLKGTVYVDDLTLR